MRQVATLIAVFILALSSNAQRSVAPLPKSPDSSSNPGVIISGPTSTSAASNTPASGPLATSENSNVGLDEYRKKYKELLDSLALKKENESKKNFDDLSNSYHYAIYGIAAAGIIICVLLGIVYGLYNKNKTLKNELTKLKS